MRSSRSRLKKWYKKDLRVFFFSLQVTQLPLWQGYDFFFFYMIVGEFQLLWSSQRKIVCSQLDQGQISNSVNQIHCSPLFLSFAFLAKGQIDTHICSRGNAVWKSFYDMMKWLLEGTNLLRKIGIFYRAHTICSAW